MGTKANTQLDRLIGRSRRAVAKAIVSRLRSEGIATDAGTFTEGSLAKQLNHLANGNADWWANEDHAPARAAFVALVPEGAALLPPSAAVLDRFEFVDFPELPTLQLREEPVPILASPHVTALSTARGAHWVTMPRGSGRTLAVRWIAAQETPGIIARSVETLGEGAALGVREGTLLVLDVQRRADDDQDAVDMLLKHGSVVVLAPFELPQSAPRLRGRGELQPDAGLRRSLLFAGVEEHEGPTWWFHNWQPLSGWRRPFLAWVAARLGRANFDPAAFADALEADDPAGTWFGTPGALICLLCAAQRRSKRGVQSMACWAMRGLAEHVLATRVGTHDPWLAAHGVAAMLQLVRQGIDRIDLPLVGPVNIADTASMLEPLTATTTEHVERVLATAKGSQVEDPTELAELIVGGDSRTAVQKLVGARLLVREDDSAVSIHPPWVAHLLAVRHVRETLAGLPPKRWGRWCIEAERRAVVDQHLDDLELRQIVGLVTRVLEAHDPAVLGSVAAVETMFAAVARLLDRDDRSRVPKDLLARLWKAQAPFIASRYNEDVPGPLTRSGPGDGVDGLQWLADCWVWSMRADPPTDTDLPGGDWLWPVWCRPAWAAVPSWLDSHIHSPEVASDRRTWSAGLLRLLKLAPDVLDCATGSPEAAPTLFWPSLLARRPAEARPAVLRGVLGRSDWPGVEFAHWCSGASEKQLQDVASGLLHGPAMAREPITTMELFRMGAPLIHEVLDADAVVAVVDANEDEAVSDPAALVRALPEHLRSRVLLGLLRKNAAFAIALMKALPIEGAPLNLALYVALTEIETDWPKGSLARRVWADVGRSDLVPFLVQSIQRNTPFARSLWTEAPQDIQAGLVREMCREALVCPKEAWFEQYLRRAVHLDPATSEAAFALLQSIARPKAVDAP